ncbi:hypothetical protein CANINC_002410 [Pichia inconspicua]|uniref:RWD domain-containing protein n=1 Tax=Pichia inconspicua TaxID=52247 RepID=A0A4T0X157_9ASCO|nr:hypothetical protein CANINC_002410 [[Candida] inconspicua]
MVESEDLQSEVGAIEAIYPECIDKLSDGIYKFKVPQHEHIVFQMSFPERYPEERPFILDVISEKSGFDEKHLMELFQEVLDSIYNQGTVIIFDLFTELDAVLYNGEDNDDDNSEIVDIEDHWHTQEENEVAGITTSLNEADLKDSDDNVEKYTTYMYNENVEKAKTTKKHNQSELKPTQSNLEGWIVSDPIIDRKSTFVSFAKKVETIDEVDVCFNQLMEDKRCARANHAMRAWRIKDPNTGIQYQDCDDDGETAAGGRMLHLMSIMDAWNVIVVCCRWFGGVHIGPDRFKHINSATRDVLVKGNFVDVSSSGKKSKRKK